MASFEIDLLADLSCFANGLVYVWGLAALTDVSSLSSNYISLEPLKRLLRPRRLCKSCNGLPKVGNLQIAFLQTKPKASDSLER